MKEYMIWEGPGWYCRSLKATGNRYFLVGLVDSTPGHRQAVDKARAYGYENPQWYNEPRVGTEVLSLEDFRERVIARTL